MYEFRPVTGRIEKLRRLIRDRVIPVDAERALAITRAWREHLAEPPMIRRAHAVSEILGSMTLRVGELEPFAGSLDRDFCGSSIYPE